MNSDFTDLTARAGGSQPGRVSFQDFRNLAREEARVNVDLRELGFLSAGMPEWKDEDFPMDVPGAADTLPAPWDIGSISGNTVTLVNCKTMLGPVYKSWDENQPVTLPESGNEAYIWLKLDTGAENYAITPEAGVQLPSGLLSAANSRYQYFPLYRLIRGSESSSSDESDDGAWAVALDLRHIPTFMMRV